MLLKLIGWLDMELSEGQVYLEMTFYILRTYKSYIIWGHLFSLFGLKFPVYIMPINFPENLINFAFSDCVDSI